MEYHQLARIGSYRAAGYRWWKPLVELVLFGGLTLILWLVVGPLLVDAFGDAKDGAPGLVTLAVTLACLLPASLLAARIVRGRAGTVSSIAGRLRFRWLGTCVLVAVAFAVVSIVLQLGLDALGVPLGPAHGGWVGWDEFLPLAGVVILVIPLQAAAEEYAFRGTLLQVIGAWVRWPWVTIAITSVIFAIAHGFDPVILVAILSTGFTFGWLAIKTGGLEAPIAQHVLNNVTLFVLYAATGRGNSWVSELNADIPWYAAITDIVTNVLYALIIARLYTRRYGSATVTPPSPPPPASVIA